MAAHPDCAVTTHPSVVAAVGSLLKDNGFSVSVADNPAIFSDDDKVDLAYQESGIKDVCFKYGFDLLYSTKTHTLGGIPFSWWVKDFNIINLPKL